MSLPRPEDGVRPVYSGESDETVVVGWQPSSSSRASDGSEEVLVALPSFGHTAAEQHPGVQQRLTVAASALVQDEAPSRREAPPALSAPRGIKGLFSRGSYGAYEKMDLSSLPSGTVIINIYDVGEEDVVKKVNRYATLNDRVLLGGVYHAGVEIYGREWGYGGSEEEGITGVFDCPPRCNWQHTYRATVDLGLSPLSEDEVRIVVQQLSRSPTWEGCNYDLLHNNCLHFANALCAELKVRNIPGWLNRFDRIGSKLQWLGDHAIDGYERTQHLARGISTDFDRMRTAAKREVPNLAQAATTSLSRWSHGLFAAASRAVGDDSKSKEQRREARAKNGESNGESKLDLKSSLRNRGGVRRATQPTEAVRAGEVVSKSSKADIDAFLLLDVDEESVSKDVTEQQKTVKPALDKQRSSLDHGDKTKTGEFEVGEAAEAALYEEEEKDDPTLWEWHPCMVISVKRDPAGAKVTSYVIKWTEDGDEDCDEDEVHPLGIRRPKAEKNVTGIRPSSSNLPTSQAACPTQPARKANWK